VTDITSFASSTQTLGEAWDFDVIPYKFFKAKITAIGNGNITVQARTISASGI
jgi:hypothetical protein